MSTISKNLSGFIFNGAALVLASAPWKGNVRAIYGFNAAGDGYQVFKPASQFNSLAQLVPDGVYTVDAATTGFELPGPCSRPARRRSPRPCSAWAVLPTFFRAGMTTFR
ncbi:hypothetical protein [Hymenobacter sp. PAMC 26628]|uniref:hypothetical protein n=1 Tax=Hymenobacter sp. PAMC 26628 TaxID=1484118 RepID=UPI00076FE832|nr:hypothetical protein [Hymenobacter sp. PAMC 26628]AMJ67407.1 hypothetical protein AXW84_19745 [Hymenobacter sp. PAMC 26628]